MPSGYPTSALTVKRILILWDALDLYPPVERSSMIARLLGLHSSVVCYHLSRMRLRTKGKKPFRRTGWENEEALLRWWDEMLSS